MSNYHHITATTKNAAWFLALALLTACASLPAADHPTANPALVWPPAPDQPSFAMMLALGALGLLAMWIFEEA